MQAGSSDAVLRVAAPAVSNRKPPRASQLPKHVTQGSRPSTLAALPLPSSTLRTERHAAS